ncbi:MAG: hypothetical protein JO001_01535 [Alphaproteobacteria bacterium]|nr:hypothetical protein [Alphaproteobacteria bacterium]
MTRGLQVTSIPVDSEIILVGRHANRVTSAAIYADNQPDQPMLRLGIADRRANLLSAPTPLVPSARYFLRVNFSDQTRSSDLPFVARSAGYGKSLLILRVE